MKHSTAQVVDAKQTRPSPAYERVWLRQTMHEVDHLAIPVRYVNPLKRHLIMIVRSNSNLRNL